MARIGRFGERSLDPICEELQRLDIPFKIITDPKVLIKSLEKYNTNHKKEYQFDPPMFEVEIADDDLQRVGSKLEKYGIAPLSDGHELLGEDYICPNCEYVQDHQGFCPECKGELHTIKELIKRENSPKKKNYKPAIIFLVFIFVLMLMRLFRHR
jgi:hypothetical protein